MKKVIVLVGPTAVGKTDLSISIAKKYDAEIINGDSTQIFKDLNIGTAKITKDEMDGVKHHLIDIKEASETYDVETYQKDVRNLIDKIDRPLIVGGTGFYIKAALDDYDFSGPKRNLNEEKKYEKYSNEELHQKLAKLDEEAALAIHPNNRRRVLRAIFLANDIKRSKRINKDEPLYNYEIIYLTMDRKTLYERINKRADQIIEKGFIEEVTNLRNRGIKPNILGYREINMYLDNLFTIEDAIGLMKKNTRRYAKRQETFFKNQMKITVIERNEDTLNKIYEIIDKYWWFMKIYLVGMPYSGKTSVGVALAKRLKFNFLDTDNEIEKHQNRKISDIFAELGEKEFRKYEKEWLKNKKIHNNTIISTGGGMVLDRENKFLMEGLIIYLNVKLENLELRQKKTDNNRPLLLKKTLEELFLERKKYYNFFNTFIVDGNGTVDEVVDDIINLLKKEDLLWKH